LVFRFGLDEQPEKSISLSRKERAVVHESNRKNDDLLSSWKEIAAYLGYDVRSCIRWGKERGLPVHRIAGASRSRVFAYKRELDAWRQKKPPNVSIPLLRPYLKLFPNKALLFALIPVSGLLLIFIINLFNPDFPADFRIDRSDLIILDKKGNELWRYHTGLENLAEEGTYREHFQHKKKSESGGTELPYLIINDINSDEIKEVLFSTQTNDEYGEGELFCFNSKGIMLWKFTAGRELKFGQNIYSGDYRINGLYIEDLNGDGSLEIILLSVHMPDWPCQLIVLNHKGEPIGEYWNSGHFSEVLGVDLDEDQRKEIIAAGTNNEYGKACVVVFDSGMIRGCSPQIEDRYICREIESGAEKYYILLPRTDVDLQENNQPDNVKRIDRLKDKRISIETQNSGIFYELDYHLKLQDLPRSSHFFERKHRQAVAEGKVNSILNDEYWADLGRTVRYWNGKEWDSKPTENLLWRTVTK
jgi:hypothetical protein